MENHRLPVPGKPHRGFSKKIVQTLSGQSFTEKRLLGDIRTLIEAAKIQVARTVDSGLVSLYWSIGKRIERDILRGERTEYGKMIFQTLSGKLTVEYGQGFSAKGLFRMVQFVGIYPDQAIVATLSRQLGWSHFVELLPISSTS